MLESVERIAGLDTVVSKPTGQCTCSVVLLHGYAMRPADLAPFARSLGVAARFYFPQAPHSVADRGYAWWGIDEEARAASLRLGPRDLAEADPPSRPAARSALEAFLTEVHSADNEPTLVVGGFSQGGMLACDAVLRTAVPVSGLIMMSASRIAIRDWTDHRERLKAMPVLVSHGTTDTDLGFAAGERLRDWLNDAGAVVTWVPFDGGHQIPMTVWREVRRFLRQRDAKSV